MKFRRSLIMVGIALAVMAGAYPAMLFAQQVLTHEQAARVVVIKDLTLQGESISATLFNQSANTVRDIQLLIRHVWLWKNEFRPGSDDPSKAFYHTLASEIPPGGSVPFTYKPSPSLPDRSDGTFQTTVSVAGFTEIIPR